MSELPKEVIAAWKLENQWFAKVKRCEIPCDDTAMAFATICDFARDTLARALEAEWKLDHSDTEMHKFACFEKNASRNLIEYEKHLWTWEQWRALAEKELRGEK